MEPDDHSGMDQSISSESITSTSKLLCEMDSPDKNIDHKILQDNQYISKEWSVTTSGLNLLNSTTSDSYNNISILKECCANPSDSPNNKEDFFILESTSAGVNISNYNADDTKYLSMHKPTAFQKKHKPSTHNESQAFENILQDNSQMEITQDSVCLTHFQKRKRMLPVNNEDFDGIISSDNSGMDSAEVSMMTPKFRFSKRNKDQSYCDVSDYNLSTTNSVSVTDYNSVSEIKENADFKKPDSSLQVNDHSIITMDKCKTKSLINEFTGKSTVTVDSASDNVLNDPNTTSDSISNDKMTSLINTSAESNTNRMRLCSTSYETHRLNHTYNISVNDNSTKIGLLSESTKDKIRQPINETYTLENDNSLNYTYNVPVNDNSIKIDLLSESAKNNVELKNISIGQSINATYTLENDPTSNKLTHGMSENPENAKNILSDTFTVENNSNETQPKSSNITINTTLADMSNIHNQSVSSLRKPNFTQKLPLNIGSQDYNITINDSNTSTVSDEMDITENDKSTKFKVKKNYYEGNSEIFENIFANSKENEMSVTENTNNGVLSKTTNISTAPLNSNLLNISSGSKSKKNIEESMEKSLTQQSSNVHLDEVFEKDKNISDIPLSHIHEQNMEEPMDITLTQPSNVVGDEIFENENNISEIPLIHKLNKSNSFKRSSYKFNFSKNYGLLSKSHENSMNIDEKNASILNKSGRPNHCNVDLDFNSQISKVQKENHSNSQITQQLSISSPSMLNTLSCEVEKNNDNLTSPTQNTTFTLSQTPGLRFIDKHSNNAHSGVFSDLIEHSINSDASVSISELVKFKSHKNVSETNSVMFENAITNSQESNTTSTQKNTLSHSIYNQSKIQGDEISIFVNMDEVLSENESLSNSDRENNTDGMLSVEESNCLELKSNIPNTTSTNSNLAFSETESFKEKDSKTISVNNDNTFNELNDSLKSEESVNNHSLSNITAGLLVNDSSPNICNLTRSTSKGLLASNITDTRVFNEAGNTFVSDNTTKYFSNISRHSTSISSMDEELVLEKDESQKSQSKRSISSDGSTSSSSDNESLSLNESLKSIGSLRNASKRSKPSLSPTSTNDDLILSTIANGSLKSNSVSINQSMKSINKSKESTSKSLTVSTKDLSNKSNSLSIQKDYNTKNLSKISTRSSKEKSCSPDTAKQEISDNNDELLNNEELTLNNVTESLKQNELSIKKSISKSSLTINTRNSLKEKSHSLDTAEQEISDNNDDLLNNEGLTLNNVNESLKQNELSIKKSISKSSLTINTRNSLKEKSHSLDTAEQEILDNNDDLLNNEGLTLNNVNESFKQNELSINESIKPSSTINIRNSSKEKSRLPDTIEPEISCYNSDSLQHKNKSTYTRVTRLSLRKSSEKTLKNSEVMLSKSNASVCSSRSSKSSFSNSNNENDNEESDNSIFWTTLDDNSTSKSTVHNVNANEFQTPTNNKLTVAEDIINKIGIMSTNKRKTTRHPGVFKLEDHVSRLSTRSSVKRTSHSPLYVTRLLAKGNNTFELATPSQSFSETLGDESQIIDETKIKFESLYNKEQWITKRLYNFLVSKLTPKYNIYSTKYAEKFVKYLASILNEVHTSKVDRQMYTDMLRYHLARYGIIYDTYDYLGFLTDYIPMPYYEELIPGWDLTTSEVIFDSKKYFIPIMEDEDFLNNVLRNLNVTS